MIDFWPAFGYIALIAFLPLIYVSCKTVTWEKLKDMAFLRMLCKDFIRTIPVCCLVMLPTCIYPPLTRWYLGFIQLLFMPLMFAELGHIYLFGTRIGLNTFFTVFVSNMKETREFISQNIPPVLYVGFAFFFLSPFVLIARIPEPAFETVLQQGTIVTVLVAFSFPFIRNLGRRWPKFKDAYILNPYSNIFYHYYEYKKSYQALKQKIAEYTAPDFKTIQSSLPSDQPQTYVIVIGESANRTHLSLYGYPRKTNEFTDCIRNELIVFPNVRSPFAQTMPSLERTLSFADTDHPNNLYEKGNMIDYFKQAGFKTYWLSNQYALDDTIVTAMASHADYNKYFNFSGMKRFEKAGLDEAMLPDIQKIIQNTDTKKVIFVHLIGSHSAYVNRYPSEFKHFTDTLPGKKLSGSNYQLLNAYDDSIRYTDYIINQIIQMLKQADQADNAQYMLYFSDHGEDIFDSTPNRILGHSELANEPMTSVPFILWLSPMLRKLRPDIARRGQSPQTGYNLQDAIHTVIDISSLANDDFNPEKSILNTRK